jgi:hypothetical protein
MKTILEWEENIVTITAKIQRDYPELSKYISEMPIKGSESGEVDIKNLKDYYESLEDIVSEYAKTHNGAKEIKS